MFLKVRIIGDILIPSDIFKLGFKNFEEEGCDVMYFDWPVNTHDEIQNINLKIEQHGCEAYEVPNSLLENLIDADIIVTQFCPINKKVIDACKNLKAIGVTRGGYENINLEYASEKGILVYNTPGRNANAVADFTVGVMICECRNIARAYANLKSGKWIRDYCNFQSVPDLPGKTVGIVGFGQIGRKVAQRLIGFEVEILIYDPFARELPTYVRSVSLEELFTKSDFITLHARLTPETEGIVNKKLLNLMKKTAYFINTSRSAIVNEKDLVEVLRKERIQGAALDVFDHEPITKEDPLLSLPNVTLTPHFAGGTVDCFKNAPKLLASEMIKFISGQSSQFELNPQIKVRNF